MINEFEQQIRKIINGARRQFQIMSEPEKWNKLCSALDLIGDTELAIAAYPTLCSTEDDGASYLIVYGVLQTLLLQQDAAKHVAEALNLKQIKRPKELDEIRVVRNSAAGHPTFQKENGLYKSCFISRFSLSPVSFQVVTSFSDSSEHKFSTVSLPSLIKQQEKYVASLLKEVVDALKSQEKEHLNMHKDRKLVDCFPQTLSYHVSKVYEATYNTDSFSLGHINLKMLQNVLDDLEEELKARSEWGVHDSVEFHYEQISYPIEKLNMYFEHDSQLNEKDAYIFTSFIEKQLDELLAIAKDIDSAYQDESAGC